MEDLGQHDDQLDFALRAAFSSDATLMLRPSATG